MNSPATNSSPVDPQCHEVLGRGGLAIVERVTDRRSGRDVARKRLRPDHRGDDKRAASLTSEAAILRELRHPGVPGVLDQGCLADGTPFFTMELIEGHDLDLLLKRGLPAAEALRVIEGACRIVAHAHRCGIAHGDLKPSNIMVDNTGRVFVIDWGLATRTSAARERSQSVSGTAAYMAPEQAQGLGADARTDVFNIGAILCRILTGVPPYVGDWIEIHGKAAAGDLDYAHSNLHASDAGAELVAFTTACLAPDPARRLHDAAAVAIGLRALRSGPGGRLRSICRGLAAAAAFVAAACWR